MYYPAKSSITKGFKNMSFEHSEFQKLLIRFSKSGIQRNFKTYQDDLVKDMTKVFESYITMIEKFLNEQSNISESELYNKINNNLPYIKSLSEAIKKSTIDFLSGNIRQAYNVFSDILDDLIIRNCLQCLTKNLSHWSNMGQALFRVRVSDIPISNREDMFHIPFTKRSLVKTQRYSVEGLPCLYLGTSLYICWQELGTPDLDKLYISAYRTSQEAKELGILDLAYTLDSLRYPETSLFKFFDDIDENDAEIQSAYLTLWPLVIACSYVKKERTASFNPEYIIPNLLMQKISSDREMNISGIAYYSTKSDKIDSDRFGVNIVIPPKSSYSEMTSFNFCSHLCQSMISTNPISWSLLSTLKFNTEIKNEIIEKDIEDIYTTLIKSYGATDFNLLEHKISQHFKFSRIKNPTN